MFRHFDLFLWAFAFVPFFISIFVVVVVAIAVRKMESDASMAEIGEKDTLKEMFTLPRAHSRALTHRTKKNDENT